MRTIQLLLISGLLLCGHYIYAQNTCFFDQERIGTIATLGEFIAQNELADIDNDGDLDYVMAYGTEEKRLDIYRNEEGGRTFNLSESLAFLDFAEGLAFALGDVTGDGFVDIVDADLSTGRGAEIRLRSNQQGSGFETRVIYTSPTTEQFQSAPRLVDFDNDGDLDITMGVSPFNANDVFQLRVLVLENQGDGAFEERTIVEKEDSFLSAIVQTEWADLNNDGTNDLLINYDADNLRFLEIYLNDGAGNMTLHSTPIAQNQTLVVQTADMDNDGDKDLVTISTSDGPVVYLNDGLEFAPISIRTNVTSFRFRVADINHDGFLDIALAGVFLEDNEVEFRTEIIENFTGTAYGIRSSERDAVDMIFGDLNRDNALDPVVTYIQGQETFVQYFFADLISDFCFNQSPSPPQELIASPEENTVILTWDEAEDEEQNSRSLTYNLALYHLEEERLVISPDSDIIFGQRQLVDFGRQGHHPKWQIRNLRDGTYRWQVQAVDNHYQGSAWSEVGEFVIFNCNEFSVASGSEAATCGLDNGLAALDPINGTAPYQYQWSNGESGSTIENLAPGSYAFTVVDANGCTFNDKLEVQNIPSPDAPVSNGTVSVCSLEEAPPLSVQPVDGIQVNWYRTADATSPIRENSTDLFISTAGTYFAEAFDPATGCTSDTRTAVELILNNRPNLAIETECDIANAVYSVLIISDVPVDIEISRSFTQTDETVFQVDDVPIGEPVEIIAIAFESGCESSRRINSPDCSCPDIAAPEGNSVTICAGDDSEAPLTAFASEGLSVNWFDENENLLARSTNNFFPPNAGVYLVQAIDSTTTCTSDFTRLEYTILELTEAEILGNLQVCAGETTTLTAAGDLLEYFWSTDEFTESIVVGAGTYTLSGIDGNNCQSSATVEVVELPAVLAEITGNLSICVGEATILTASGGVRYVWNTGETSPSISVNQAGTYSVEVTDELGCTAVTEVEVVLNPSPSLTILEQNCAPNLETYEVRFSTSVFNDVDVSAGELINQTDGFYLIQNVPAATDITISLVDLERGCSTEQVVPFIDCDCPFIEAPEPLGDITVCANEDNQALGVAVNESFVVNWFDETGDLIAENTTSIFPSFSGSYFAQATDTTNACVSDLVELRYEILPLPEAKILGDVQVCAGETTTLTAAGDLLEYFWSTDEFTESIVVGAGTYTLSGIDGNNCQSSATVEVVELPAVLAEITGNLSICVGEATILTASGGVRYVWNTGETSPSISVNQAGTYSVEVTDELGCIAVTEVEVALNPSPSLTILEQNCAPNLETYEVRFSTSVFNDVDVSAGELINQTDGFYLIQNVPTETDVTISLVDLERDCSTEQVVPFIDCDCPFIEAPEPLGDIKVCANEDNQALGVAVNESFVVNWFDETGDLIAENTTSIFPSFSGSYFAQATDITDACVSDLVELRYEILPLPEAKILGDVQVCAGETTTLTAAGDLLEYFWSTDEFTESIVVGAGTYTLSGIDGNNCQNSATASVTEFPSVEPPTNFGDVFVCEGAELAALQIDVFDNQTAEWYDAEVDGNFLARGTSFTPTVAGTYYAQAVDVTTNCSSERIALRFGFLPTPTLELISDGLSCFGDSNATIEAITDSENTPYIYAWSNGASSERLENVGAGVYELTLTDANGCSTVEEIEIFEPVALQAFVESQNTTCGDANGNIAVVTESENLPIEITWNTNISGFNLSNLAAGIYTATITDALGCTWESEPIEIADSGAPTINLISTISPECGESNGNILVEVSGGTAPYLYTWSNESADQNLSSIAEGIYILEVTDAAACTARLEVILNCEVSCLSAIGTMNEQSIQVCETEIITAAYDATNEFLNENDIRQFILHNGSATSIGNQIIARSAEPSFAFLAAQMRTETTYYITAVVGESDDSGNINLFSDCLAISNGTPVRFRNAPAAVIELQVTNTTVCLGDSLQLTAAIEGTADSFLWETPQGMFTTTSSSLILPFFSEENIGDYFVSYLRADCESPQFGPISITLDQSIEGMTAGENQVLCGDTETQLEAILPPDALGRWVTTSAARVDNPDLPDARVSNLEPGAYNTFYWRVYTEACSAIDTMTIYYLPAPELEDKEFEMSANNTAILLNKDFLFDGDARLLAKELIEFEILTQPEFGIVRDTTGGLLYEKDTDQLQEETIRFSYQACVSDSICGQICETANVEILVRFAESEVIAWRSALRPNGNNPLWSVQILQNLSEAAVKIVDRWGQIVHVRQLNDGTNLRRGSTIADAWDGRNREGEILPQGAYYFLFTGMTDEKIEVEPVNGVIYLMD